MRTLTDTAGDRPAALLIALLAGTYSEPGDFVREGFPAAVRGRGIPASIVMAETPPSLVADASIVDRLRDEVVGPARKEGLARTWLAGISLGGLAALAYAARHGDEIEGVVLLAPYPGTREVLLEIDAAGGLAAWRPAIAPGGDIEREAWAWLARRPARPRVHLYYGRGDRFAEGQRRLARCLGEGDARELDGAHDWPAWRAQWERFLDDHGAALGAAAPPALAH